MQDAHLQELPAGQPQTPHREIARRSGKQNCEDQGRDPDGVVRDPVVNEMISFTFSKGQANFAKEMAAAK